MRHDYDLNTQVSEAGGPGFPGPPQLCNELLEAKLG